MNILIGMSKDFKDYPSCFKDEGYTLEIIEPKFINSEAKTVNPDILLSSNGSLNAIVSEVKKGHISQEEVDKYNAITGENLRNEVEDVFDLERLTSEFIISGTTKTEESFDHLNLEEPGLIFGGGKVKLRNRFKDEKLNQKFKDDITIPDKPPTNFYPFSPNDKDAVIVSKISQSLMVIAANTYGEDELEFSTEDILEEAHPYWNRISGSGKKEIKSKTETIIEKLMDKGLDENMEKIKGEDTYFVNSSKAFQNKAQEVLSELSTQETLEKFTNEEER